eukprot:7388666-Prymnesium_polylepis.1
MHAPTLLRCFLKSVCIFGRQLRVSKRVGPARAGEGFGRAPPLERLVELLAGLALRLPLDVERLKGSPRRLGSLAQLAERAALWGRGGRRRQLLRRRPLRLLLGLLLDLLAHASSRLPARRDGQLSRAGGG